jgi:hypothetical protein
MLDVSYIINDIIIPTQNELGMPDATNLLLGTFAQESKLGQYLTQIGGGPALGIGQIEPATNNLVLGWALENKPDVYDTLKAIRGRTQTVAGARVSDDINLVALQYNHQYNCAIARTLYFSISVPLPDSNDIVGLANYWKEFYNRGGKGTIEEFVTNYRTLVQPFLPCT